MKNKLVKVIASSLLVFNALAIAPQKVIAATFSSTNYLTNNNFILNNHSDCKGKWIFDKNNQKNLTDQQKKQLEEIKKAKDNGCKLSDDQKNTLKEIKEIILKNKLGEEKYKEFKCLIEKRKSDTKLTKEEEKKLKEFKNIIKYDDCDNHATFKQFLR